VSHPRHPVEHAVVGQLFRIGMWRSLVSHVLPTFCGVIEEGQLLTKHACQELTVHCVWCNNLSNKCLCSLPVNAVNTTKGSI
jgi:hypothetical protein